MSSSELKSEDGDPDSVDRKAKASYHHARSLLDQCMVNQQIDPNEDGRFASISRWIEFTDESEDGLVHCFLDLINEPTDKIDIEHLVSDVVRLPDRLMHLFVDRGHRWKTISEAEVQRLSRLLQPRIYCSRVLWCLCSAMLNYSEVQRTESSLSLSEQVILPRILLQKLILTNGEQMLQILDSWWQFCFLAVDSDEFDSSENILTRLLSSIFQSMDAHCLERYFRSAILSAGQNPDHHGSRLEKLFGLLLGEPEDKRESSGFQGIMERNLFFTPLNGPDEIKAVIHMVREAKRQDLLIRFLKLGIQLFTDQAIVEFGTDKEQMNLCFILSITLGYMTEMSIFEAKKEGCLRTLIRGTTAWLDAGPGKREIGMSMVTVALKRFGKTTLPEWKGVSEPGCQPFGQLWALAQATSCQPQSFKEPSADSRLKTSSNDSLSTILRKWAEGISNLSNTNQVSENSSFQSSKKTLQTAPKPTAKSIQHPPSSDILDSDDDEDDLPAFDMSHDTPKSSQDASRLLYLRDAITALADPEHKDPEYCLQVLPELCGKHLRFEDPSLVEELMKSLLFTENKFDSKEWPQLRNEAVLTVIHTRPVESVRALVPAFYDRNHPLVVRSLILNWLVSGARGLAQSDKSNEMPGQGGQQLTWLQFTDYIRISVTGLCSVSGWSQLDMSGFDSQLLSQLLLSVGELLRLGENLLGWENLASLYLEMSLASASPGSQRASWSAVEAAVLHSIRLVAAVLKTERLLNSSCQLHQQLSKAAVWASQRQGQLHEQGQEVAMLLALHDTELRKIQMEAELNPAMESITLAKKPGRQSQISYKTPSLSMKGSKK